MSPAAGPADEIVLSVGRAVVDALRRRDWRQATSLFGPALLDALPPKALQEVWERTEERFGTLGAPMSTRVARDARVAAITRAAFANGFADVVVTFGDDGTVIGLSVVPARGPGAIGEAEAAALRAVQRRVTLSLPVFAAVAAGLALGVRALGVTIDSSSVWWGAAGWALSMVARGPLSAVLAKRLPPQRAARALAPATGVVEEIVRVAVVATVAPTLPTAANVALGWSAVEVLYGALAAFIAVRLAAGGGERAEAARMQLVMHGQQAHGGTLAEIGERVAGAIYQAGATLLVARVPAMALMLAPVRGYLEHAPISVGVTRGRALRAIAAAVLIAGGLTAHGKL